jgi:uncharacterized protein
MFKNALLSCILLLTSTMFAGPTFGADEPTLHQVYQAVEAGRLNEAQGMMDKVLRDHPNSAKAHFVEAEILAKQGNRAGASAELGTAERLAPGLPFAKPEAVENLRQRIASSRTSSRPVSSAYGPQSAPASGIPVGLLLVVSALIAAVVFFVRRTTQRSATVLPTAVGAGYGTSFGSRPPYGGGGVVPPMGPATGGMGSGILGGLATGAALGAGMVAGEALAHRLTDGGLHSSGHNLLAASTDLDIGQNDLGNDLSDADFGISDGGSWDDSSSGGGDDWN